ncbi:pre-mRNA-processing factor 6-like [Hylaeus volcanicus]|uniref:pre-mRNA-processing factor 6-like n=1 Tax=Hylaeus volcanicus TaxID=313075 RepID=UPI0023B83B4E|nr:pre-mRNA-processing factor 6-like [Hylaeus volcanicus]
MSASFGNKLIGRSSLSAPGYISGVTSSNYSIRGNPLPQDTLQELNVSKDPFGQAPFGYVPGRGRGATGFAGGVSRDDTVDDRGDYSETNYDEFSGYSEGLFRDSEYDEEDRHADLVYDQIEQRIDTRRRSRREAKLKNELSKFRAEKPTIVQQFADLKRGLANVTLEEWDSIPDIGDYTLKVKQKKPSSVSLAPDSLLVQAHASTQMVGSIDPSGDIGGGTTTPIGLGLQTPFGLQTPLGLRTPLGLSTPLMGGSTTTFGGYRTSLAGRQAPSLNDLGEARGTVLSVKLDKVMDNVSGQTVIDPKGYLTDLNSMPISTDAHIADVKKARLLLRSVIQTNPQHAPGWIAAARLEELRGKLQAARELIAQGCINCPKNEDIWLEAARFEKPVDAKAILANGIKQIPQSVKLWQEAANKESDIKTKKIVLRKALQFIPNSVKLWKEAISMEEPEAARIMLTRAVECVPQSVEIWLALARLSSYADAQKVLNEARKQVPTSVEVWISAAKLEETHGNLEMVEKIITRAVTNLSSKGVNFDREHWLKFAEESEKTSYKQTCIMIVKVTMSIGVESVNRARIWLEDAEGALSRGCVETARSLYTNCLQFLRGFEKGWISLAQLELHHGTSSSLDELLCNAVKDCPGSEALWLMAAKQKWLSRDVNAARQLLSNAFTHVENKEAVSLAAVKLERETGEFERARVLLQQARLRCNNSVKVWIQSIQLERFLQEYDRSMELVRDALRIHPNCDKLWMIYGQLHLEKSPEDVPEAIKQFEEGLKHCSNCIELWLCAAEIYLTEKNYNRARAVIEEARFKNPKQDLLWLFAVRLEKACSGVPNTFEFQLENNSSVPNLKIAHHMMSRALQECPKSGVLWSEAIFLEPTNSRNAKSVCALNQCENDPYVILAIAKLFWANGKLAKARRWMNRTVTLNSKFGDAWGAYFLLELALGNDATRTEVIKNCTKCAPNAGIDWNRVVKKPCHWTLSYPEKLRVFAEHYFGKYLLSENCKVAIGEDVQNLLYGRQTTSENKNSLKTINEITPETHA